MHFSVSIEFWGDKNDYLRYGSKWDDIMNKNNQQEFAKLVNKLIDDLNYEISHNHNRISNFNQLINSSECVFDDNLASENI